MKDWNDITPARILIVLFITACIIALFNGCTVYESTYSSTPKHSCELMDRGQACLSDHSCCKDRSDEVSYWRIHYVPTITLYYYNDLPYWGYYGGYYYYYGYRHIYPWWYYYNFIPSYHYSITTHVHCNVGNRTNKSNTKININKSNNNRSVKPNRNNTNKKSNSRKPR
jgi:hypothetical protein